MNPFRPTLLYRSVRNGLLTAFAAQALPARHCMSEACPDTGESPAPEPEGTFNAFFTGGGANMIQPYATSLETGIGAPLEGSYDLAAAGMNADLSTSNPPVYGPGLMFVAGSLAGSDKTVYAFTVDETGVTRIPGELGFTSGGLSVFGVPAVAYLSPDRVIAFAANQAEADGYQVKVGEVSGGAFAQLGATLTLTDPAMNNLAYAAVVLDGHLCLAVGDSSQLDLNRFRLRSYSFDGANIVPAGGLDISAQFYRSGGGTLAGPDYIAMIRTAPGYITEIYDYTAAGGFTLRFSTDLETLVPGFASIEAWLIDQANGNLWVTFSDGIGNYRLGVFAVGALGFTELAVITIPEHIAYFLSVHDDVLAHNDATYNDTLLSVRSGAVLTALAGTVPYDSSFFLPLLPG